MSPAIELTTLAAAAATALQLYEDIRAIAVSQGMDPDAFDKSASDECARLQAWKKQTDAAEDAQFPK